MYTTVDNIMSFVCGVFRGRGRYVDEDFDLDLTYITERIIGEYTSVYLYNKINILYVYHSLTHIW